ncbi:TetR/AcrR family transcriptional regulator [Halohasta salina]|uniref:TetR/AcrR family transcriptional regulator n=1 Tax=Halohasta salina TaxID=2961621 RepID=UPI0020A5DFA1|nr:TetR/AcrR family transcriptional regulator [Halohasta salina]
MSEEAPLDGEPADTHEAIMMATFAALQKHGYPGISIQRIADESDLTKSTFYHHFDGKDDILLSFVQYMRDYFERGYRIESTGDPVGDLEAYITVSLGDYPAAEGTPTAGERVGTYLALRAQAIQNPAFREEFTELSAALVDYLAEIVRAGIDEDVFEPVDPDRTAEFIITTIEGINLQKTTRTDDPGAMLRDELESYLQNELLVDNVSF